MYMDKLIDHILAIELEMFLAVNARGDASCQSRPDDFRLHRKAQLQAWPGPALESYREDLERARDGGINLMTIKYARMENIIPRKNHSDIIEKIAGIQYGWQMEMFKKYPNLMGGARPLSSEADSDFRTSFETYLKGELETYSEKTLRLLYDDMLLREKENRNYSIDVYSFLVTESGYRSLDEAEEIASQGK